MRLTAWVLWIPLVAGCSTIDEADRLEDALAPGDILLKIGHKEQAQEEEIDWGNGTKERLWSARPEESAVTALYLFVKCVDQNPIDASEFTETRRLPPSQGAPERVILERGAKKDVHNRLFRVTLSNRGGLWIPEAILICQGAEEGEEF